MSAEADGGTVVIPRIFYFGPWDQPGHHFFGKGGRKIDRETEKLLPWGPKDGWIVDGGLLSCAAHQGEASIHHKDGWTAMSFWDRSVDKRPGCNSTYIAEGSFTFDEMVSLAKTNFTERWARMAFAVTLYTEAAR